MGGLHTYDGFLFELWNTSVEDKDRFDIGKEQFADSAEESKQVGVGDTRPSWCLVALHQLM